MAVITDVYVCVAREYIRGKRFIPYFVEGDIWHKTISGRRKHEFFQFIVYITYYKFTNIHFAKCELTFCPGLEFSTFLEFKFLLLLVFSRKKKTYQWFSKNGSWSHWWGWWKSERYIGWWVVLFDECNSNYLPSWIPTYLNSFKWLHWMQCSS